MNMPTQVLLLGPMATDDVAIIRAVNHAWLQNTLYRAPNPGAAVRTLTECSDSSWPIKPDLILWKIHNLERTSNSNIRNIRRHKLLSETPIAAIACDSAVAKLKCLRNTGLNAVLSHTQLHDQFLDIVDAVVDYWVTSYSNHCNNRYFCPDCRNCIMINTQSDKTAAH